MAFRKDKSASGGSGFIQGWVRTSIRHSGLIMTAVLAMAALGIFGLFKMNKDEFPTFEITQGLVAAIYPGIPAAEVEQQLTKPLEEFLFTYKEVDRKATHSVTKDGICYIYVSLNVPQKMKDEVWSKLKLGLQTRKMTLPMGVLAVAVLDDFSNTSSLLIAMESDDKSYFELQDYAEELCSSLRTLPDLAKATVVGAQQEEIAVTLDRARLSSYGLDPTAIMLACQTNAATIPSGNFKGAGTDAPVHIISTMASEREVAEKIIYTDPQGGILRLGDVATIQRRYKAPEQIVSYNGRSCLIVNVEMRPDNNIVEFGREVDGILSGFEATLPASVRMSRVSDQPKVVGASVWSFLRDLLIAMLVVIFVMLMLFPMRSALIASSGLPICTAISLAIMYIAHMDINTVSLAALIVVLGMIVDDSIITMDGYMDKMGRGLHGADAAASSAKELFMPTFLATMAIGLMFFPAKYIISGYLGDFISLFPWIILISLLTSLFYAVTVVPSLEVRYIRPQKKAGWGARVQDKFFSFIQRVYENAQDRCFRHPKLTLAGGVLAVLLGLLMFSRINIQMMPMAARQYFVTEVYLEPGCSIERTRSVVDSLEHLFLQDKRVKSVTSFAGTGAPRFCATYTPILPSPQSAQIIVNTKSQKATELILAEFENKYEHLFPEAVIRFKQMDYQAVEAPIVVRLKGSDRDELVAPAQQIKSYMAGMSSELKWVHSDADDCEPSVNIRLDSDEAARLGVNKALLSLSLAGTFDGQNIASFWESGREIPVNLYSEGLGKELDYGDIGNQMVATSIPGVSIPLRQIATVEPAWAPAMLSRNDGTPSVAVYADMKLGKSQPAAEKKIKKYVREHVEPELPAGVTLEYCGLSSTNSAVIPEIAWSFLAAVAILFFFLLIHFKKVSIAVLTLVMSLLCLFGAFFGLWIFHLDFSITAVLGLISLVGIIVRNGILMFEYAEEARFERGLDVRTAALEAGRRRMRPIFLTSCTTALGVLPMIISGDLLWMPMGVVICFGTCSASSLSHS